MAQSAYAVIDVETTGLNPALHDRVIDIAIVQTDEWVNVTSRWETLVNPGRDLGPQGIQHMELHPYPHDRATRPFAWESFDDLTPADAATRAWELARSDAPREGMKA